MSALILTPHNRNLLAEWLATDSLVVACLCAAWCDVCRPYQSGFDQLAAKHPDKHFVWIDVEDQADLVGDLDIENFPTLLIQRGGTVGFFGTVQPDPQLAHRLVQAHEGNGVTTNPALQNCNLQTLLAALKKRE